MSGVFFWRNAVQVMWLIVTENVLAGRNYPPIICTLAEAKAILLPITMGYKWGESTIKDLWSRCAPTPDSTAAHEKRIISPSHLGEWLADVLERQGRPADDAAKIFLQFQGARLDARRNYSNR